jgi:hypothetical protein
MWLKQLKSAIVQQDIDLLGKVLDDIPKLEGPKEIEEAQYLLKEATTIVHRLKDETARSMMQLQKNIDFLNATTADKTAQFDITS